MNLTRFLLGLTCIAAVHLVSGSATAQPTLRLIPLGPADALHADPETGTTTGWFPNLLADGLIVGATQQRGASNGWTVWMFSPETETTTLLGLHDPEHTASNGSSSSSVHGEYKPPTPGLVFGHSDRYVEDTPLGQSAWRYRAGGEKVLRIGLFDDEHTSSATRERITTLRNYNARGDAIGWSRRYVNGTPAGQSAWHIPHNSNATARIGLVGGAYVSPVGIPARHSEAMLIADCGVVAGVSTLYHGAPLPPGRSAWVFDPDVGITVRAGLIDAEYVDASGYHNSNVVSITPDGAVIGTSERFINGQNRGATLWCLPRGAPRAIPLGLTDAEHTSASGTRMAALLSASASAIVGSSTRWQGGWIMRGRTAWIYNRTTGLTAPLGLTDQEHTSAAGARTSHAYPPLPDGRVLGFSERYVENTIAGATPWLWDPASGAYTRLGFTDALHTRPANGYRQSSVRYTLPTGFVVGSSLRWTPEERTTAWAYELSTGHMTILGISDKEHTVDSSGLPDSRPALAGDGQAYDIFAAGRTRRADGSDTPWFQDPRTNETLPIGLWDSRHTSPSGERDIWVSTSDLIAGRTHGSASRYIGEEPGGRTPFMFDTADGTITPLVFTERADGYAWSSIVAIAEDGTIIGSFLDHDAPDDVRFRGYIWTPQTGMTTLDDAVKGGFESAGYLMTQYEASPMNFRPRGNGVWSGVAGSDQSGWSTFVLVPMRACIADFDQDGQVASPDFFAFLTAWFAHDPRTDLNGEGGVDSADLFAFLAAWFTGCE